MYIYYCSNLFCLCISITYFLYYCAVLVKKTLHLVFLDQIQILIQN